MKKRASFLAGVVSTLLVLALGTTALAASGKVTFSFSNIALNGETKIAAGSNITVANGQKVPGSILYVDEAGGKTNYLPIRAISELLGVDIDYDSTTKTVHLNTKRWQREIEGKTVSYICGEENNIYDAPPTWRPVFVETGWGLVELRHDTRNYTASWTYENGEQEITFKCAAPSTASFGRQMSSIDVAANGQKVEVLGESADYYDDGKTKLLAWENKDGILFFVTGRNVEKETLIDAAKSVKNCTATVPTQSLGWLPSGYSMMDHYEIADTVMEYWVRDNVAMSWTYSAEPLGLPAGDGVEVEVGDTMATYWDAELPFEDRGGTTTVNGEEVEGGTALVGGVTVTSVTVPGSKRMNTLMWTDSDTGTYFKLQSILDMDTMIRIAENVK